MLYYVTKLPVVVKYIQITQYKSLFIEWKHFCSLNLETKISHTAQISTKIINISFWNYEMNSFFILYLNLNDDAPEKNPVDSAPNTTISKSNDIMTNSAGIHQSSSRKNLACPSSNSFRQVHILTINLTISPSCCNLLHVMFSIPNCLCSIQCYIFL